MSTAERALPPLVDKRLTSNSRSRRVVEVIHREGLRRGYGPTVLEARVAYERTGQSVSRSFTSEIHSLYRRGLLEASGRPGSLRFLVAGATYDRKSPPLSDAEVVLQALRRAVETLGTMASTRDVLEFMKKGGQELESASQNAVRSLLLGLTRERERGPDPKWSGAQVRLASVEGLDGRSRSFWAPIDETDVAPPDLPVASKREALIASVDLFLTRIGRLPSGPELVTLLRTLPPECRIRHLFPSPNGREGNEDKSRYRPALMAAIKLQGPEADRGRLRIFRSDLVAHGGRPVRFWVGEPEAEPPSKATAASILDDFVYTYRLGIEVDGIVRVRRSTSAQDVELLEPLMDARARSAASVRLKLERTLPVPIELAASAADAADERYYRLLGEANGHAWSRTRQKIRRRHGKRRAAVAAAISAEVTNVGDGPEVVGHFASIPLKELEKFTAGYIELGKRGVGPLLNRVRRFPNPHADGWEREDDSGDPSQVLALVDRPEALCALAALWAGPWTRQMVTKAYQLIGEIARPLPLLEDLIHGAANQHVTPSLRRRCFVAGALVGLESVVPLAMEAAFDKDYGPDSIHDVRTAALATALVRPSATEEVLARLGEWDSERRFADLHRQMSARKRRGLWLSIAGR